MFEIIKENSKSILAGLGVLWTVIAAVATFIAAFIDYPKLYEAFGFVHISQYKTDISSFGNQDGLPQNSVVAFIGKCPIDKGWSEYAPATARFILGAGSTFDPNFETWQRAKPNGGFEPVKLVGVKAGKGGGEFDHILSDGEMAVHTHRINRKAPFLKGPPGDQNIAGVTLTAQKATPKENAQDIVWPKVEPHNNMPPFIALHFCRKDQP